MAKRVLFLVAVTVIFISTAPTSEAFRNCRMSLGYVPNPRLIAPSSDEVRLSGKKKMEFKWSPHEGDRLQRKYYDF